MFSAAGVVAALLLVLQSHINSCQGEQYKVRDLDCWGLPPPSDPFLYSSWSQNHRFHLGDSLLFLYPPSQDSVVQLTARAFSSCHVAELLLTLGDDNSLFNLTAPGYCYFTSNIAGHCEKNQKLAVAVPSADGTYLLHPADVDVAPPPGESESNPIVFGPTPAPGSGSRTAPQVVVRTIAAAVLLLGVATGILP